MEKKGSSNINCAGWPCGSGFSCEWCSYRPQREAELNVEELKSQNGVLRRLIADLQAKLEVESHQRLLAQSSTDMRKHDIAIEDHSKDKKLEEMRQAVGAAEGKQRELEEKCATLDKEMQEAQVTANKAVKDLAHVETQKAALQRNVDSSRATIHTMQLEIDSLREDVLSSYKEKATAREEAIRATADAHANQTHLQVKTEQLYRVLREVDPLINAKDEVLIARAAGKRQEDLVNMMVVEVARDNDKANAIKADAITIRKQAAASIKINKSQMRDIQSSLQRERAKMGIMQAKAAKANALLAASRKG